MSATLVSSPENQSRVDIDRHEMHTDFGVYTYPDGKVTVISQPTVNDTIIAIAEQPADKTTILTPELALLEGDELTHYTPDYQRRRDVVDRITNAYYSAPIHIA